MRYHASGDDGSTLARCAPFLITVVPGIVAPRVAPVAAGRHRLWWETDRCSVKHRAPKYSVELLVQLGVFDMFSRRLV